MPNEVKAEAERHKRRGDFRKVPRKLGNSDLLLQAPQGYVLPYSMHELWVVRGIYIVREVDEELCEAALGSCVVTQDGGKGSVTEGLGKALTQSLASASVIAQAKAISNRPHGYWRRYIPKETSDDMFQQANCLLLDKLIDHVAQHGANSIEAFVCLANVCEANVI